jgi:hypothetical protein
MIGEIFKTNCYGDVEVIDKEGDVLTVQFLNTGYVRKALVHNVRKGKVKDNSVKYTPPTMTVDEHYESNSTGWFTIIQRTGKRCIIQFDVTGYTATVNIDNAKAGKVKDPYFRSVYGVGYLGEFNKKTHPYWKQASQLWRNMLKRCYSKKDSRGYYGKGVSVDERWLCFANFLEDISELDNFDLWLKGHGTPDRYNLDKDLKVAGNKVYSKDLCSFVSEFDNKSAGAKNSIEIHGLIHLRK